MLFCEGKKFENLSWYLASPSVLEYTSKFVLAVATFDKLLNVRSASVVPAAIVLTSVNVPAPSSVNVRPAPTAKLLNFRACVVPSLESNIPVPEPRFVASCIVSVFVAANINPPEPLSVMVILLPPIIVLS